MTPDPCLWRKLNDSSQVDANLHREGIQRIATGHRWRCLSPWDLKCWDGNIGRLLGGVFRTIARRLGVDMAIGWEQEAKNACARLSPEDADVILASGPPFLSFRLAKSLSGRLGRPYVLDYRDPWVVSRRSTLGRSQAINSEEKEIVETSSAVTIISPSLLNGHINLGSKKHVITNGFDPEELREITPHDFGHFAIVYAGVFYPPKRVITPVLASLKLLNEAPLSGGKETLDWKFHYFGPDGDHVLHEAQAFGITDKVCIHGRVPRVQALSAVRGSSVTVVITSVLDGDKREDGGTVTGKLFEPLGMGVPVLLIGPSGSDADMITEATGLVRRLPATEVEGMTAFLKEVMAGKIPAPKNPQTYAWPSLAKDFDAVLRRVISTNTDPATGTQAMI